MFIHKEKLFERLNIIKFLTSRHSFINPTTLINISSALLLSIIDYGLPIYGHHAGSEIKKLYAPYHTAIRRSLRAFPTSSTKNILVESGLPHINERLEINTLRLIPKVYLGSNPSLLKDVRSIIRQKRIPKCKSAIDIIVKYAHKLDINLKPIPSRNSKHPTWALNSTVIEDKLVSFNKTSTNKEVFKQLFMQRESELKLQGWKFIYTDGSKTDQNTAYAVVSENSKIITKGLLLPPCSVFTAEAYAIKVATQWIMSSKGKYVICTDSFSTISAVQNPTISNTIIKEIRDNLIDGKRKIKLMWVPRHCDIKGNELADKEAKNTIRCRVFLLKLMKTKIFQSLLKSIRIFN
uniref:Pol polyprotein n=1 Tax=Zeugodacus cucurbitae TaxID=28588 RepID=A0A0A1WI36_ZEUCU